MYKCVSEYIFLISKQTNKQTEKTRKQKAKETREEKRISVECLRGYNDIICKFLSVYFLFAWSNGGFFLVVYIWCTFVQQKKYSICYTTTTYDVHTFTTKIKENH